MLDPAIWGFVLTGLAMAAVAYGAMRLAGRLTLPAAQGRRLQVLEALPLGRDRALFLVRVGEDVLLVGSAPGGVALVHTPDPELAQQGPPATGPLTVPHWFGRLVRERLRKEVGGGEQG